MNATISRAAIACCRFMQNSLTEPLEELRQKKLALVHILGQSQEIWTLLRLMMAEGKIEWAVRRDPLGFKLDAVEIVEKQGYTIPAVAQSLGAPQTNIN